MANSDDRTQSAPLRLRYGTAAELLAAFERELLHGAVFVPTPEAESLEAEIGVVLDLAFCDTQIELRGEVVAPRPELVSERPPGVSLRLSKTPADLRRRLVDATGIDLPEPDATPAGKRTRAPRFEAVAPVEIELEGESFVGETANLSYSGMLLRVAGVSVANGASLCLRILPASDGPALELRGQVVNQMPCDTGARALGIQFLYELERYEEVSQFVDSARSLHHARSLVTVSGSLRDVPLETVLETAAGTSSLGTVVIQHGDEQGRIAYREGEIVSAVTGLEVGERALSRMFCWTEAQFEVRPDSLPSDLETTPLPLTSALLLASVERDELARLDLGHLTPDTTFEVDDQRMASLGASLDELSRELTDNAALGFPVGTLLDMASASDVLVYKALNELIDAGVLRVETTG